METKIQSADLNNAYRLASYFLIISSYLDLTYSSFIYLFLNIYFHLLNITLLLFSLIFGNSMPKFFNLIFLYPPFIEITLSSYSLAN